MPITEQDILDNYEKELLYSFRNLTLHNNIKEISRDSFLHWKENNLREMIYKCCSKDINFDKLADEILRIATEKEDQEILKSYEKYAFSFNISSSYLCYFEYGNTDNLTDNELRLLSDFEKKYKYETYNEIYGIDFKICKISNLGSDCYELFFREVK